MLRQHAGTKMTMNELKMDQGWTLYKRADYRTVLSGLQESEVDVQSIVVSHQRNFVMLNETLLLLRVLDKLIVELSCTTNFANL